MRTKIKILALVLTGQLGWAQTEEKRTLPDFTEVSVSASTTVYLKKSDTPYFSLQDPDSLIRIVTMDGKLAITGEEDGDEKLPTVTIGYVSLQSLIVTGDGYVKSLDPIQAGQFKVSVGGAAKSKLELTAQEVEAIVNGAGNLVLKGSCTKLKAASSGASSLKAEGLVSENVDVITSGAATARVNATEKLMGSASGASTLKIAGDPKQVEVNQSGAANVKRIDYASVTVSKTDTGGTKKTYKDSTRRYTINGRYEIIIHENFERDTATWHYRKKKDGRVRKQNWAGIDLFENGLLTWDNKITLPANYDYMSPNYGIRNLGWNLNLYEKDFRFGKGHTQIVTGLGFSFNYYAFRNKTTLNADSSYTGTYAYNTTAEYHKNKLRESFVTIPLLLELNTSRRDSRNFHIAAGVIGGLKLGSSTKQVFTIDTHTFETVRRDDYNLYPFKLDATVRIGYGPFVLFGTYSLTPLFESGKGPQLYPFTVGVRLIPFA